MSDPDVFSDKTHEIMTPPSRSKDKEYEELYHHVIKEADPLTALNQVIIRDKKTYDFYKDGLH